MHVPTWDNLKPKIRTMKYISLLTLGLAFALPLHAEEPKDGGAAAKPKPTPKEIFAKKDKDNDGFLSKEEFSGKAKDAAKAEAAFTKKDTNGDGKISLEEFTSGGGKGGKKHKNK